jgi:hypothetical protein
VRLLRLLVLVSAAIASAASGGNGGSGGASGGPTQHPTPYTPSTGTSDSVEGLGFTGTDGTDRINFYFRKGGTLHYRDPQGWWEDGKWTQEGQIVKFSLSDGFVDYTGTVNGATIVGTATNQQKKTWSFRVQRGTPRQPPAMDLTNSSWGGKEDKTCIVFQFRPGGVLEYDTPSGHYTDGTWEIDGAWVYFKHKKTGFEYFGSVKDAHMNGNLWSTNGQRWSWDVNKDVVPDECGKSVAGKGTGIGGGKGGSFGDPSKSATPTPVVASLEGSTWEGDNGGDVTTFRFKAGGVLEAKDPQGNWKGTWFQNGSQVSFDLNGRYSWYEGLLDATGTSLAGGGKNKDGLEWKFLVKKK